MFVTTAVMPKGVEHLPVGVALLAIFLVTTAVMPKGVEHSHTSVVAGLVVS